MRTYWAAWIGFWLLVAASVAAIALGPRYSQYFARQSLEAEVQRLRAQGARMSLADLVSERVDDKDNAALDLRAAAGLVNVQSSAFKQLQSVTFSTPLDRTLAGTLETVAKENADALKLVRSALSKSGVDWQLQYNATMVWRDSLPQRQLASVLHACALLAHDRGDDLAALQHIDELLFMGEAIGRQAGYWSHYMEIGIESLAFQAVQKIGRGLKIDDVTREQAARRCIAHLLDETKLKENWQWSLESGRVLQVETAIAVNEGRCEWYSPNSKRSQQQVRAAALKDAQIMLARSTSMIDAAKGNSLPEVIAPLQRWAPVNTDAHPFYAVAAFQFEHLVQQHFTARAERRVAATALAIRWYAAEHKGRLPERLEELVPQYLPEVPQDPCTQAKPLIYLPAAGVIYSVGVNGKDDGGTIGPNNGKAIAPVGPASDIVVPLHAKDKSLPTASDELH